MKITDQDIRKLIQEELDQSGPQLIKVGDILVLKKTETLANSSKKTIFVNPGETELLPNSPEALQALATEFERAATRLRVWASYALSERQGRPERED